MADIEKVINGLEKLQEEISRTKSLWTEPTVKALEDAIELLKDQQAEIKALREEKEKTESNFTEYVDEKREDVEELKAKIKLLEFELKKYEELVN